jgi:hypothetical protein
MHKRRSEIVPTLTEWQAMNKYQLRRTGASANTSKLQDPNTKIQRSSKSQKPIDSQYRGSVSDVSIWENRRIAVLFWSLRFGASLDLGSWCLELFQGRCIVIAARFTTVTAHGCVSVLG